jgi:arylsulfatase A-like enzyme
MGDHWLGEKDLFFDCSARIPLIVYDPRAEADSTRGTSTEKLIEGIDLAPTFHEILGGEAKPHVMEGKSLHPLLHGQDVKWRNYCVSEYDYSTRDARQEVNVDQSDARLVMVFDGRWKYIHVELMRPLLFDLKTDPDELHDLGDSAEHLDQINRLRELHFEWARQHHSRITRSPKIIEKMAAGKEPPGIYIAYWDRADAEENGLVAPPHLDQ